MEVMEDTKSAKRRKAKKAKAKKAAPHPNAENALIAALARKSKLKPQLISLAQWTAVSYGEKRQHDDGTCWLRFIGGNRELWFPVYWRS